MILHAIHDLETTERSMYGKDFLISRLSRFFMYDHRSSDTPFIHPPVSSTSSPSKDRQVSSKPVFNLSTHNRFTTHPKITETNETEQDKAVQRNNMLIRPIYINPSTNQVSNQPHMNFVKKVAQVNPVFCCLPCSMARCLVVLSICIHHSLHITYILYPVQKVVQYPNPNPYSKLPNSQSQPVHQQEDIHLYNKKIGEGVSTKYLKQQPNQMPRGTTQPTKHQKHKIAERGIKQQQPKDIATKSFMVIFN